MRSTLVVIGAVVVVLSGCDHRDADYSISDPTTSTGSLITSPAAPERGPIPPDANAAAPGTNASLAFAENSGERSLSKDDPPADQKVANAAQDVAAKAPDTAAADAAKLKVYEEYAQG